MNVIVIANVIVRVMSALATNFKRYLTETTGLDVALRRKDAERLPVFLRQLYDLFRLEIGGEIFTGIFLKPGHEFTASAFRKQLPMLMKHGSGEKYVLVAPALSGFSRRSLIEKRIPFVVPETQIHWPELGVVLRARQGQRTQTHLPVERVSPATQAVIVFALTTDLTGIVTPKELTRRLGYTPMSMTRALNEMESAGLAEIERVGRERHLHLPGNRRAFWERARPRMRNPVRMEVRLWERDVPEECRLPAGETALARRTMLAQPAVPVFAVGRKGWRAIERQGVERVPEPESGTCLLQVWLYEPSLFCDAGGVDVFSLYLSLEAEQDERVAAARETMMEKHAW